MTRRITVAIDGPAGAGKSTVAKAVAEALGYSLVDTGAIYRTVALIAQRRGVSWDDSEQLGKLVGDLRVSFAFQDGVNHVLADGDDVTTEIRTPEISQGASKVSAVVSVREGLLDLQRELAGQGGAVLEGRDIGTVVFPDAPLKVFLDAAPEERARRRFEELRAAGAPDSYESVLRDVKERDERDTNRSAAPLKPADDAVILDSTQMDTDEVISTIVGAAQKIVEGSQAG